MEIQLIKKVSDFLKECIANHGRKFNGAVIANKHGLSRAAWDVAESLYFVTDGKQKKSKLAKVMPMHAREVINNMHQRGARIEYTDRAKKKDMAERHNIMKLALESMPSQFNSLEFAATCKQLGLERSFIRHGGTAIFLHVHAQRGASNKMWYKNVNSTAQAMPNTTATATTAQEQRASTAQLNTQQELTEQQCIDFLKERGYKIFKTITVEL